MRRLRQFRTERKEPGKGLWLTLVDDHQRGLIVHERKNVDQLRLQPVLALWPISSVAQLISKRSVPLDQSPLRNLQTFLVLDRPNPSSVGERALSIG